MKSVIFFFSLSTPNAASQMEVVSQMSEILAEDWWMTDNCSRGRLGGVVLYCSSSQVAIRRTPKAWIAMEVKRVEWMFPRVYLDGRVSMDVDMYMCA